MLALLGATLVAWGAWNPVLRMPLMGDLNLFTLDRSAAWTLCAAVGLTMAMVWLRFRAFAWLAFLSAVASVALLCHDFFARVDQLKAMGAPAHMVDDVLRSITIKPGAVGVGAGLVILAVSLGLSRRRS